MRPTRPGSLVALLLGVTAVVWGLLRVAETRGVPAPDVTWAAPSGVAVIAAAVLTSAVALRRRLQGDRPAPHPLGIARMAVLGKASAHVGPIVGGFYLGYLLLLAPRLGVVDRRDRAVICLVALVAALALSAGGLWLERLCRVPPSDADNAPPTAPA